MNTYLHVEKKSALAQSCLEWTQVSRFLLCEFLVWRFQSGTPLSKSMINPWSHIGYLHFLAATGEKKKKNTTASEINFHNIYYLTQKIQKLSFQCVTNLKIIELVYRFCFFTKSLRSYVCILHYSQCLSFQTSYFSSAQNPHVARVAVLNNACD